MSPAPFVELPDPAHAASVGDLVDRLRRLKVRAGDPSYETIKSRVNAAWTAAGRPAGELARRSTVANCFQPGRRRMNTDLVLAVVEALHPDAGYVTQWRQALRAVGGEIEAVSQVRVQGDLPQDLAGFTGRAEELDRLRRLAGAGDTVVLSAIEGMAGVGKTRLAVHAGHRLLREQAFDQVLFVNLRGFDPDPAQPPADPAAVLDGFLRLLGVPAHRIPHGLAALTAAYRERLADVRALVVLDNAATAAQVRPLLPATPGSLGLVTSRRRLDGLDAVTHLSVDLFTPGEAEAFLTAAVAGTPLGPDPAAVARIAERSGCLPLALSLVAGHIRSTPGWTLTDHADRLDERHRDRRLDTAVELALDLSYRHLPADHRRLLRLAALHPGNDLDAYAAAALTGSGVDTARDRLDRLVSDHLLQLPAPGRYAFHDLVRAFATVRAGEEERPPDRRAALTRVFDYYLAAAAGATNTIHSAKHSGPAGFTIPGFGEPGAAVSWLETERPTLVAVAAHTVAHGWPTHTIRLSRILYQHLGGGGYHDAEIVHGHAYRAALAVGDPDEQARALTDLANTLRHLARTEESVDLLHRALALYGPDGHPVERARILNGLADAERMAGRHGAAIDYFSRSLEICRQADDPAGEARASAAWPSPRNCAATSRPPPGTAGRRWSCSGRSAASPAWPTC